MRSKYSVSDAEWEVLNMLWKHGESIRQPQLLKLFEQEGKEWKRQTLNTFLTRLEEKGLVIRENGLVSVVYEENEYKARQMKESIDNLYGGKVSNFLAAFMERNELGKEEAEELYRLVRGKVNNIQ